MSEPDDELQAWLETLTGKVKKKIRAEIDKQAIRVRDAIKSAAAIGETHHLADSVRIEPGRHDMEVVVTAGGPLTTKQIRKGSGIPYDYALAIEFGTTRMEPNPFFYSTWRVMEDDVNAEIEKAVEEAL